MKTISFISRIKNGVISIPSKYREGLAKEVTVILFSEDSDENADVIDDLISSPLKISGFAPMSRDEIYSRSDF